MKIKAFPLILVLFLLSLATSQLSSAQTAGQSSSGSYQFSLADGYTKYVEFDAQKQADGTTVGSMFLSDEALISYQDVDGTGDPSLKEEYKGFSIKAEFDSLMVNENQAVMSGTISDSTIRAFIGQRVLLTVEDNGDNSKVPDKLTWGIYQPVEKGWTPSDAERRDDPGVGLRWMATDAERKDDVGVSYPQSESLDSQSFPLSSYSFVDIERGAGDIKVQQ